MLSRLNGRSLGEYATMSDYTPPPEGMAGYFVSGLATLIAAGVVIGLGWYEDAVAVQLLGVALGVIGTIITLVGTIAAGVVVGLQVTTNRAKADPESRPE